MDVGRRQGREEQEVSSLGAGIKPESHFPLPLVLHQHDQVGNGESVLGAQASHICDSQSPCSHCVITARLGRPLGCVRQCLRIMTYCRMRQPRVQPALPFAVAAHVLLFLVVPPRPCGDAPLAMMSSPCMSLRRHSPIHPLMLTSASGEL